MNLIFDEIELYFHPEFQRTFVTDLLKSISDAELKSIEGINMVFITHSPFILSDIPKEGVMYLEIEDGRTVQRRDHLNSFAGNIHEILASSFFFKENYTMGEFVRGKIQETLNWCNNRDAQAYESSEYYERLVDIIDEPIMKMKLAEMVAKKLGRNGELARLQAQRRYIDNLIKQLPENDSN